jgi:putative DNA primase/helicase
MPNLNDIIAGFRDAFAGAGLVAPAEIVADGDWHRCAAAGGRQPNDAGSYLLHTDHLPTGILQNFRDGDVHTIWHPDGARSQFSKTDRAEIRRRDAAAKAQLEAEKQQVAEQAERDWAAMVECDEHPYLTRKGVKAHGLRKYAFGSNLVIPMRDAAGKLWNIQIINEAGDKEFLWHGRKKGTF